MVGPDDPWAAVQVKRPPGWEGVQVKRARPTASPALVRATLETPDTDTPGPTGFFRGTSGQAVPETISGQAPGAHPPANAAAIDQAAASVRPLIRRIPAPETFASGARTVLNDPEAQGRSDDLFQPERTVAGDVGRLAAGVPRTLHEGVRNAMAGVYGVGKELVGQTREAAEAVRSPTSPIATGLAELLPSAEEEQAGQVATEEALGSGHGGVPGTVGRLAGTMAAAGGATAALAAPLMAAGIPAAGAAIAGSVPVATAFERTPEGSTAHLASQAAEALGADRLAGGLENVAQNPVGRRVFGAATDVGINLFAEALQARRAAQAAREAEQARMLTRIGEATAAGEAETAAARQAFQDRANATTGLPVVEQAPPRPPRPAAPEAPAIPPELEGLPLVGEGPTGVPLIGDRPIGVGETPRPRPTPASEVPPAYTVDQIQAALRKRQRAARAAAAVEPAPVAPAPTEAPAAPQGPMGAVEALRRRRLARGLPDLPPVALEEVAAARKTAAEALLEKRAATRLANTDHLTGIGNTRALDAALPRAEADPGVAVISFDANNFGKVNKQLGNKAGDQALKELADAMRGVTDEAGAGFRVFRRGGDEFVALVPAERADEIRTAMERAYGARRYGDVEVSLSGNVGRTFDEADAGLQARKAARKAAVAVPPDAVAPPTPAPAKPRNSLEGIWFRKSLPEIEEAQSKIRWALGKAQAAGDNAEIARLETRQQALESAAAYRRAQGPVVKLERTPPAEGSVTPSTVRGRTVHQGGDPLYRTTSNEALADKWRRLMDRVEESSQYAGGKNTRQNRGAPGRAAGRMSEDLKAVKRIEDELHGRGITVRGRNDIFDAEGRTIGTGTHPEDLPPEDLDTSFDPESLGEAGSASQRGLRAVTGASLGAAGGAVVGAASAEPGRRGEGAFYGAVGGALAGYGAATLFTRRAKAPTVPPLDVSGMYVGKKAALPREAPKGLLGPAQRAYQDLLDHVFAAREFGRRVGGTESLSHELERSMSWHGLSDTYLGRQGQEGPTLARALRMAEGREADVTHLLQGERALELHDRAAGSALHLGLPEGISAKGFDIDRTRDVVERLSAIPEVRKAADAYREFYRNLLDERLANRLISHDQYQRLVAAGEHYTPFLRDYGSEEFAGAMRNKVSEVSRSTGLRDLDVDEIANAPLRDPFALAVFDAQKTARDIAKQRVTNLLTDIIAENPEAAKPFIQEVSNERIKEMTPGQRSRANIQELNVDGEKRFYAVHDRDLLRSLEHAAPLTQSVAMRILQAAKTIKRVGVTIVPEFGLTNAQKDLVFTANQYPVQVKKILAHGLTGAAAGALIGDEDKRGMNALKGFGFGVGVGALAPHAMRTLSALGEVLGNSKGMQQWLRDGGGNTGFYLKSEEDAVRLIRRLRGDNYTLGEIINPKTWWGVLEHLQGAVEQAPRYARYKYLRGLGKGAAEAVSGGHNVSVNFLRHGGDPMVQGLGKVTAFWNANLQGKAKLWRDLGVGRNAQGNLRLRNPKAWALGATAITAPTIALWMQNQDDPAYWEIPLWERNLFWHIPTGTHENGKTKFVKLAKPFELGYLFASLPERFLDYMHQRDPQRLRQALGDMASQTFVDGIVPIPDIAQPTLDVTTTDRGYSRFTGRPVESQAMGRLPPAQRSDQRTSFPAKALGERLGVSPTKIDYWWRQTTGTLGRDAADLATSAARRLGLDDRAPTEPRGPLDRFQTRQPGFSADPVEQLYLRNTRAEQAVQAIRTASSDAEARKLYERYKDDLTNLEAMQQTVAKLADVRKALREVEADRSLPLEERRKQVQELQDLAVDLARSVVDAQVPR